MIKFSTLTILCLLLLSGCAIQKRRYSNGYHTTWNVQKILPKKNTVNKFENEKYLRKDISKNLNANLQADIDTKEDSIDKRKEFIPLQINQEEKKNQNQQLIVVSDTLPDKLYSKEEENFLENGRKLRVARTVALSSFITIIASIALYLVSEGSAILILLPIGIIGALVFGILSKVYLTRKIKALEDLLRSMNNSSDNQTKSNALNNLLLVDLQASIKLTKLVTLLSGIAVLIALMIDNLEIGALGFLVFPIPLIVFCITLLALLVLIIKKGILNRKIKK